MNDEKFMESLSETQIKLIDTYIETGSVTKSGIAAGYSPKSAYASASRALKSDKIRKGLAIRRKELKDELFNKFYMDALKARQVLLDILENEETNPQTRYLVAKDLLDRAGFKTVEKSEVDHNVKGDLKVLFNIPRPKANDKKK